MSRVLSSRRDSVSVYEETSLKNLYLRASVQSFRMVINLNQAADELLIIFNEVKIFSFLREHIISLYSTIKSGFLWKLCWRYDS